jgi:hypothetical protein
LRETGIDILRVSPQSRGTLDVLQGLRAACDGARVQGFARPLRFLARPAGAGARA